MEQAIRHIRPRRQVRNESAATNSVTVHASRRKPKLRFPPVFEGIRTRWPVNTSRDPQLGELVIHGDQKHTYFHGGVSFILV